MSGLEWGRRVRWGCHCSRPEESSQSGVEKLARAEVNYYEVRLGRWPMQDDRKVLEWDFRK